MASRDVVQETSRRSVWEFDSDGSSELRVRERTVTTATPAQLSATQPQSAKPAPAAPEAATRTVTVREWAPLHSSESLPEIEAIIDSWGPARRMAWLRSEPAPRDLEAHVDRLTGGVDIYAGTRPRPVVQPARPAESGADPVTTPVKAYHKSKGRGGFLRRLRRKGSSDAGDAGEPEQAAPAVGAAGGASSKEYQPQCVALTADGSQCRNSAREGSKYCAPHFGYQPPTAKGLAQRIEGDAWDPEDDLTDRDSVKTADTEPRVAKAKDTVLSVRKRTARGKVSRKKR